VRQGLVACQPGRIRYPALVTAPLVAADISMVVQWAAVQPVTGVLVADRHGHSPSHDDQDQGDQSYDVATSPYT
jgi:hypothetical protein